MQVSLTMNDKQVTARLRLPRALVISAALALAAGVAESIRCEQRVAALQSQLDRLQRNVSVQTAIAGVSK